MKKAVILYHSEHYIIIDKEFDILINSDRPEDVTVQNQLKHQFPQLANSRLKHDFHFAHRLDFSTSGALCIALTKNAAKEAMASFSSRNTRKYYLALLRGHVKNKDLFTIDVAIGDDSRVDCKHRMCTAEEATCENPRPAVTKLLVLQHGFYDREPVTKVILQPITGRRHQLRLHCRHIGHTIVGDYTYSDRTDTMPHRMFLHSYHLVIPTALETIDVTTDDPFLESQVINKWTVSSTIHHLNDCLYTQFE